MKRSGNYVADSETYPQQVQFANGRVVSIRYTAEGRPFLDVRWSQKEPDDTFVDTILAMSDSEIMTDAIWEYGSPEKAHQAAERIRDVIGRAIEKMPITALRNLSAADRYDATLPEKQVELLRGLGSSAPRVSEEVVERVAIALSQWRNDTNLGEPIWEGLSERFKSAYREQAKAALAAMQEQQPTRDTAQKEGK